MKTTKKQFEYFKTRCVYWQDKMGLHDWYLSFSHIKLEGKRADTSWNRSARKAHIRLSMDWGDDDVDNVELDNSAAHECFHLVLCHMDSALCDYLNWDKVDEMTHAIINKVLRLIVK